MFSYHGRVVSLPGASASKKTYTSSPRSHQLSIATHLLVGVHHPPKHTHHALLAGRWSASILCAIGTAVNSWVQHSHHLQKTLFLSHIVLRTSGVYCLSSLSSAILPVLWDATYIVTMSKSWTFDFCFIILALCCVVIEILKNLGHLMREELLPHPKAQKSWMYCIYLVSVYVH